MCPASICGAHMATGLDEVRRLDPNHLYAHEVLGSEGLSQSPVRPVRHQYSVLMQTTSRRYAENVDRCYATVAA